MYQTAITAPSYIFKMFEYDYMEPDTIPIMPGTVNRLRKVFLLSRPWLRAQRQLDAGRSFGAAPSMGVPR